uniref:Uncharacterized protein n=1 Tax=Tanacetum cinerariifolium TaxID=118510 RepID=A0A6L2L9C5_TANCI|nr:hypothetical protein [Tanacetum cinerariifolium]
MQTTHDAEEPAIMPHDSPLPRFQSLRSVEGSLTLNELTVLCTKLPKRVEDLQSNLQQTKLTYGATYTKLILMGRKIAEIDENPSISLVQDEGTLWIQEDSEIQGRASVDTEILLDQEEPTELVEDLGSGEKGEKEISTVIPEVSTVAENLVYIRRSVEKRKDKEKAIMKEDKYVQKKDAEIAKQLQEAIAKADSAHDIDWNDPAVLRYHALQNRSFSVAKQFAKEVSEKKDDSSSKPVGRSKKKTVAKKRICAKLDEESAKRQNLKDVTDEKATVEVHTLFMDCALMEINMLVKKKYPLIKELLKKMLNLQLEAEEESTMAFELIKFIKSLLEE